MQKLTLVAGDVTPAAQATLVDAYGNLLNLQGASVRFRMVDRRTGLVRLDAPASRLQDDNNAATWGGVAYNWRPADTARPGLYSAKFVIDFGNGPTHYPPGDDYFILINPG